MSWTDPITWVFKQVWSAALFNEQFRDNLNYLKSRPSSVAELGSTNQTGVTTAWVKVTGSDLQIILPVTGTIEFGWRIAANHTTANTFLALDVFDVDNNVYLSSGLITPSTHGLQRMPFSSTATGISAIAGNFTLVDVPAGTHNYEVRVLASAASAILQNSVARNTVWVREVG